MLSDSESEVESLHRLTINEHYAKAFEYKKEREELQKLKEKYGSDAEEDEDSDTDSEDAESEDENGEELTPAVDAAILRTLAKIKRKDPEIYTEKDIFAEEQKKTGDIKVSRRTPKDKAKPVTIRQVALESALNPSSRSPSPELVPHVEEQRALRDETIAAFHHAVGEEAEDDEDDGLLIPREKTKDEQEQEEEEYRSFLEREVGEDIAGLVTVDADDAKLREETSSTDDVSSKKKKKKDKNAKLKSTLKSQQETDQEFLMNYILNRGWIDRAAHRVPTYGEITKSKKGKEEARSESGSDPEESQDESNVVGGDLDEDDFEEIVDRFESSYNFRFEEPEAAVIKSYPRDLQSVVRREDTTRKDARQRRKQRKEEELLIKKEEVKRLKALKMKDIRAKLERIGREGGKDVDADSAALQELDLEGDWDPEAHDRQMAGLYANDDSPVDEKPQWEDDIDIGHIVADVATKPKKKKKKKKATEKEDDGVDIDAMDAEIERVSDDEEWDGTEEMRKRKLDEYMDEIYGLDFNDIVGGMPTRFKYTTVQPKNFALTPAEILMATDAELNEYVGIKKYAPYRKDAKWDTTRNDRLKELKQKVSERVPVDFIAGSSKDIVAGDRPVKKRKGKKERMKLKGPIGDEEEGKTKTIFPSAGKEETEHKEDNSGKKRKAVELSDEDDENVKAQDISVKKKRRRHKKKAVEV